MTAEPIDPAPCQCDVCVRGDCYPCAIGMPEYGVHADHCDLVRPDREPARLGDLFPDVTDHLAELAARTRVDDRHTTDDPDGERA